MTGPPCQNTLSEDPWNIPTGKPSEAENKTYPFLTSTLPWNPRFPDPGRRCSFKRNRFSGGVHGNVDRRVSLYTISGCSKVSILPDLSFPPIGESKPQTESFLTIPGMSATYFLNGLSKQKARQMCLPLDWSSQGTLTCKAQHGPFANVPQIKCTEFQTISSCMLCPLSPFALFDQYLGRL